MSKNIGLHNKEEVPDSFWEQKDALGKPLIPEYFWKEFGPYEVSKETWETETPETILIKSWEKKDLFGPSYCITKIKDEPILPARYCGSASVFLGSCAKLAYLCVEALYVSCACDTLTYRENEIAFFTKMLEYLEKTNFQNYTTRELFERYVRSFSNTHPEEMRLIINSCKYIVEDDYLSKLPKYYQEVHEKAIDISDEILKL